MKPRKPSNVTVKVPPRALVRIGCAGWSIAPSNAPAFPRNGTHLQRYAEVFNCVEINSSFYRPHRPETYRKWAESVPPAFRFSVKMPKAISHIARLRACSKQTDEFLSQAMSLGKKLGCVLLQLPPSHAYEAAVVTRFFKRIRIIYGGPLACEPRHASWFTSKVGRALRKHQVALVAADPAKMPRAAVPGGDHAFEYARLHGSPRMYYDAYPSAAIDRIARRLLRDNTATHERWGIFDNTALGYATLDALAVVERLSRLD